MNIRKLLSWLGIGKPMPAIQSASVVPDEPQEVNPLPAYFALSWAERRQRVLDHSYDGFNGGFAAANSAEIKRMALARGDHAQLHVIFNIGADALAEYMRSDNYKNIYECPMVGSKVLKPSATRRQVDELIGLAPAENFYFCAASIGGTGMRYYGEYCVALKSPDDQVSVKEGLDRNSYDLIKAPLAALLDVDNPKSRVDRLKFKFRSTEFADMLAVKVLQHQSFRPRLLTAGNIGEAVLSDEDYVELFHEDKIRRNTILEVRSHPEDEMTETAIQARWERGGSVSPQQLLWLQRRQAARKAMDANDIVHRVVSGSGRVYRWS